MICDSCYDRLCLPVGTVGICMEFGRKLPDGIVCIAVTALAHLASKIARAPRPSPPCEPDGVGAARQKALREICRPTCSPSVSRARCLALSL